MTDGRQNLGKAGEDEALRYLESLGLKLRVRNWRSGHLELDLVMEDASNIRIVEVKTLREEAGFDPELSVNDRKRARIIRAAARYAGFAKTKKEIRFDVVAVTAHKDGFSVRYIPDAFLPIF